MTVKRGNYDQDQIFRIVILNHGGPMKNLDNTDFGDKPFDIMSSFTCYRKGMRIKHCTEGLLIYDGCTWKKVEGSDFNSDKWRDWTFELNGRVFKSDELLQLA